MPSDEKMETALRVLADPIEKYRSAVVTTAEEVRGYLASHQPVNGNRDEAVAMSLGVFAAGRIDIDRFSTLLTDEPMDDPATLEKVEAAYRILNDIASGGNDVFRIDVTSGTRLGDAVAGRLSEIGRAFAAGRVAGMATLGSLNAGTNNKALGPLDFADWNTAERQLAPPLAIEVDGADLRAGELAEFLDGNMKIVLVVRGESSPAPLIRLVTPSTFVLQTTDETGFDRFAAFDGPAVAAIVPEGAARFIHDPAAEAGAAERVQVLHVPEEVPKKALGGKSVRQQTDELEQLKVLASYAGEPVAAAEGEEPVAERMVSDHPVDQLAAWLLSQADLSDV